MIRIMINVRKNFIRLKEKSKFLKVMNVAHEKVSVFIFYVEYNSVLADTFRFLNFEKNFNRRLRVINLIKCYEKVIKLKFLNCLKSNYKSVYLRINLIQSKYKSYIIKKKINSMRSAIKTILRVYMKYKLCIKINKIIKIQTAIRT